MNSPVIIYLLKRTTQYTTQLLLTSELRLPRVTTPEKIMIPRKGMPPSNFLI